MPGSSAKCTSSSLTALTMCCDSRAPCPAAPPSNSARQFQLDFIPSQTERYCLICHEKSLASPALQQMLAILRSTKYRAAVNALPGYKVQKAGVVMDLREAFGATPRRATRARSTR